MILRFSRQLAKYIFSSFRPLESIVKPISKESEKRHFSSAPWIACGLGPGDSVGVVRQDPCQLQGVSHGDRTSCPRPINLCLPLRTARGTFITPSARGHNHCQGGCQAPSNFKAWLDQSSIPNPILLSQRASLWNLTQGCPGEERTHG